MKKLRKKKGRNHGNGSGFSRFTLSDTDSRSPLPPSPSHAQCWLSVSAVVVIFSLRWPRKSHARPSYQRQLWNKKEGRKIKSDLNFRWFNLLNLTSPYPKCYQNVRVIIRFSTWTGTGCRIHMAVIGRHTASGKTCMTWTSTQLILRNDPHSDATAGRANNWLSYLPTLKRTIFTF